jgi:ADP-ribose pyrophosphatase
MLKERKNLYSGRIVHLVVDTVEINGREAIREVVHHPGGVVVLAELEDGRIPFVRQSRYPMDKVLLELPAGKLDPGEPRDTCAARELEEEAGFRPLRLDHVFDFYSSPGFSDEIISLYHTNQLVSVANNLDHDEDIEVEFYTLDEAVDLSVKGEITDAKTMLAIFWLSWKKRTQGG